MNEDYFRLEVNKYSLRMAGKHLAIIAAWVLLGAYLGYKRGYATALKDVVSYFQSQGTTTTPIDPT